MKSVVNYQSRGTGGLNTYRGNCSPKLIEDIIRQYKLQSISDYMVGSGTTEDVCKEMNVSGTFSDLNRGFDMIDMDIPQRAENIFWHPPYHDIVVYSDKMYSAKDIMCEYDIDPRINDLSRCKDWDEFVRYMNYCMMKQFYSLEKGGRMFVLMGDIKKKGKLYSMLCDIVKPGTLEQIVIKLQNNCTSSKKVYTGNFIPIIHEYLMVIKKENPLMFNLKITSDKSFDVRDSKKATWRDVVASVLEENGESSLKEIYLKIAGHKKCRYNKYWREKVRQTLRVYPDFISTQRGKYRIA